MVADPSWTDSRAAVLLASADLAVSTWRGVTPNVADLEPLDHAVRGLVGDEQLQSATALEATAELASIYFDVTASAEDWEAAERAIDVMEIAMQTLCALVGADDSAALSVRMLLASAEVRWALIEHDDNRIHYAIGVLDAVTQRTLHLHGETHQQTISAQIELATAKYRVCAIPWVSCRVA